MSLVVDASVALKWFLTEEPQATPALAIVQDRIPLIAPDFLIAEVCNAAWRSARLGRISQAQVDEIAAILPSFFEALVGAISLASRVVAIAAQLDHPVYDCLYLALAELDKSISSLLIGGCLEECAVPLGRRAPSIFPSMASARNADFSRRRPVV